MPQAGPKALLPPLGPAEPCFSCRDPRQQGHGAPSPAFRHRCRRREPLRPPRPSEQVPFTLLAPRLPVPPAPAPLSPFGCGSGTPAELHLPQLRSQPGSWQGPWPGWGLSCQRCLQEAWARASPRTRPLQPGAPRLAAVGPDSSVARGFRPFTTLLEPPGVSAGSGGGVRGRAARSREQGYSPPGPLTLQVRRAEDTPLPEAPSEPKVGAIR